MTSSAKRESNARKDLDCCSPSVNHPNIEREMIHYNYGFGIIVSADISNFILVFYRLDYLFIVLTEYFDEIGEFLLGHITYFPYLL